MSCVLPMPRRVTSQRQEPADSSSWGPAPCPSMHTAVGAVSQRAGPSPSRAQDCVQSSGPRGHLGLGSNLFSNQVAYSFVLMDSFSESFSYPHQEKMGEATSCYKG